MFRQVKWTMCCLVFVHLFSIGFCYLKLVMKMEERQNSICFTVGDPEDSNSLPASPEIALVLQASYPQSIAEAGQIILNGLNFGQHNLTYKYIVTNMTHDLQVFLDGIKKHFLKSDVPRWYSVSTFREVSVLTQGNVQIGCKESDPMFRNEIPANTTSSLHAPTNVSIENIIENVIAENVSDNSSNKSQQNFPQSLLSTLSPEILKNETNKTSSNAEKEIHATTNNYSKCANSPELPKKDETEKLDYSQKAGTGVKEYVTLIPPSYHDFMDAGRTESSSQCLNGDCGPSSQNFTLAYVLIGVLVGLVFFAIVVSLVFHKKKKKYLRAPPTNRMRQLYESSNLIGETQFIVEQLTSDISAQPSVS